MKAPEKLYVNICDHLTQKGYYAFTNKVTENDIEYVCKDAFIEKACEFLKSYCQDTYDGTGYIADIINDKTIEDFRNYMGGE